jgi:hypothetical protein
LKKVYFNKKGPEMRKLLATSAVLISLFSGLANAETNHSDINYNSATAQTQNLLLKNSSLLRDDSVISKFNSQDGEMMQVSMRCGFKPFPPFGCTVGACVCDQNGNNCQWTMICR